MDKEDTVNIYTLEYYLTIKITFFSPFVATWMDLEGTVLSEMSQ